MSSPYFREADGGSQFAGGVRESRRSQQLFRGGAAPQAPGLDRQPPDRRARGSARRAASRTLHPPSAADRTRRGSARYAARSAELSETVESIVSNRLSDVSRRARLSAPPSISDTLLTPLVTAFQASYPNVRVQILVTDRFVDHIAEGIDLTFRLGALEGFVAGRKADPHLSPPAAGEPGVPEGSRAPQKPQDLLNHRLLAFLHWKPDARWSFVHKNGKDKETLSFQPFLAMNDYSGLAPALLDGAGIGELPPVVRPSSFAPASWSRSCRTGASGPSISPSSISATATFRSRARSPNCRRPSGLYNSACSDARRRPRDGRDLGPGPPA